MAALGLIVSVGLAMVAVSATAEPRAMLPQYASEQRPAAPPRLEPPPLATRADRQSGSELIALSTVVGDKYQQVVVVDPRQRVLSVYHVELASGNVKLCCVRNIQWDLQMTHYNGENPLPREIQSLLQSR
jgi:hypothetical protein